MQITPALPPPRTNRLDNMVIYIRKPQDTRFHVMCDQCRTDRIALTHTEAKTDALRHRQWHLTKGAK